MQSKKLLWDQLISHLQLGNLIIDGNLNIGLAKTGILEVPSLDKGEIVSKIEEQIFKTVRRDKLMKLTQSFAEAESRIAAIKDVFPMEVMPLTLRHIRVIMGIILEVDNNDTVAEAKAIEAALSRRPGNHGHRPKQGSDLRNSSS